VGRLDGCHLRRPTRHGDPVAADWLQALLGSICQGIPDATPCHGSAILPDAVASDERQVAITVNGERWALARSLADCGPESRVFTVRSTSDGTVVTFGDDGLRGKVPTLGARIVLAVTPDTPVPVSLHRTASPPTPDQPLWTVICRQTDAIEVELSPSCEPDLRGRPDEDAAREASRWRAVALLLGAALLALAVWCAWIRVA
jgi:hypothetical protein